MEKYQTSRLVNVNRKEKVRNNYMTHFYKNYKMLFYLAKFVVWNAISVSQVSSFWSISGPKKVLNSDHRSRGLVKSILSSLLWEYSIRLKIKEKKAIRMFYLGKSHYSCNWLARRPRIEHQQP